MSFNSQFEYNKLNQLKNNPRNSTDTLKGIFSSHISNYQTSVNLPYTYSFGSAIGVLFAIQLATGIFLAMYYTPHTSAAFASLRYIMTDVAGGYIVRFMHANGASFIFILIYLHIGKGLYYKSYLENRKAVWFSGLVLFLLMMGTAFIGYVLPWGQMSYWGATVITNLITAVPFVGERISFWIWGGFSITNATLTRFFSLHYLLPFIITALIMAHLAFLHKSGSSNPTTTQPEYFKPFSPHYVWKDLYVLGVVLFSFFYIVFFEPNLMGHPDNYIPANPLVTPAHIVPEWYFTPFYAILRAFPDKALGVIAMVSAIVILALLPFFNAQYGSIPVDSSYCHKATFCFYVFTFGILMFLGNKPVAAPYVELSQLFTFFYFSYFLILIPASLAIDKYLFNQREL